MRKLLSIMALFVLSLMMVSLVSADLNDVSFVEVEIDGHDFEEGDGLFTADELRAQDLDDQTGLSVDEGETLEIEVRLQATETTRGVQIEAEIRGYEYDDFEDLDDRSHLFDIEVSDRDRDGDNDNAKTRVSKDLSIDLPRNLEDDRYLLQITVDAKDEPSIVRYVVLQVEAQRHGIDIADVAFSPGNSVQAGRSLLTTVLLENYGDRDEDDVKVTVEIPELGVSTSKFVDEVETDDRNVDYEDVPQMWLQVPADAASGDYEVTVTARYDDLRETVSKSFTVHVEGDERFQDQGQSVLAAGPELQVVPAGSTATYAVALTNNGFTSRAYMVQAASGDWASTTVSESLVVLSPGQNKVVYVDVTPNAGASGDNALTLAVSSGGEVLETVTLSASVVGSSAAASGSNVNLRNGLEIALVVLVVLLVIIGLIIGFSRLRRDGDEDEEQTYY